MLRCFYHVITAELGPEYPEVSQWKISILSQVAIHSHLPQAKLLNHSKHSCTKGRKKKEMSYIWFYFTWCVNSIAHALTGITNESYGELGTFTSRKAVHYCLCSLLVFIKSISPKKKIHHSAELIASQSSANSVDQQEQWGSQDNFCLPIKAETEYIWYRKMKLNN